MIKSIICAAVAASVVINPLDTVFMVASERANGHSSIVYAEDLVELLEGYSAHGDYYVSVDAFNSAVYNNYLETGYEYCRPTESYCVSSPLANDAKYFNVVLSDDFLRRDDVNAFAEKYAAMVIGTTDMEKLQCINNIVCDMFEYDSNYIYTPFLDSVADGKGVCYQYAKAYDLIARKCGYQTRLVYGTALASNGSHAYIELILDGEKWIIDPTWGDTEIRCFDILTLEDAANVYLENSYGE